MEKEDLEKPLDPALTYFDATPSIEELARLYGELKTEVQRLGAALELQANINRGLLDRLKDLMDFVENGTEPSNALILPDRFRN